MWLSSTQFDLPGPVAPQSAKVPYEEEGLNEMLKLMDFDKDREISWREFHTFISYKASASGGQTPANHN